MSFVYAIDPGVRSCGVARYGGGVLLFAKNTDLETLFDDLTVARLYDTGCIVVESPRTYSGRAAGGADANDLIAVAYTVGRIEEAAKRAHTHFTMIEPRAWKGTVDKQVMCRRIWSLLSPEERRRVDISALARQRLEEVYLKIPNSATHPLDAVGLGLHALKRLVNHRGFRATRK